MGYQKSLSMRHCTLTSAIKESKEAVFRKTFWTEPIPGSARRAAGGNNPRRTPPPILPEMGKNFLTSMESTSLEQQMGTSSCAFNKTKHCKHRQLRWKLQLPTFLTRGLPDLTLFWILQGGAGPGDRLIPVTGKYPKKTFQGPQANRISHFNRAIHAADFFSGN